MTRITDRIAPPHGTLGREFAEFLRETRPDLLSPYLQRRPARGWRIGLAALAGAAAIILVAGAHAFAAPAAPVMRMAQEQHACAMVLGLDPSEAPYQDCVLALDRNLPQADPPQAVARPSHDQMTYERTNMACADIGLDQGSPAFSQCVTDIDRTLSPPQIYR